jgi:hypothetical protein
VVVVWTQPPLLLLLGDAAAYCNAGLAGKCDRASCLGAVTVMMPLSPRELFPLAAEPTLSGFNLGAGPC